MFVILPRLEEDVQEYVQYWNSHLMRHNRLADCPNGVPNELFELPSLHSEYTNLIKFYKNVIVNTDIV